MSDRCRMQVLSLEERSHEPCDLMHEEPQAGTFLQGRQRIFALAAAALLAEPKVLVFFRSGWRILQPGDGGRWCRDAWDRRWCFVPQPCGSKSRHSAAIICPGWQIRSGFPVTYRHTTTLSACLLHSSSWALPTARCQFLEGRCSA